MPRGLLYPQEGTRIRTHHSASRLETSFRDHVRCKRLRIGAVLGQCKDKQHYAISYASKTLTGPQLNYATTEKELLMVVFTMDKFRSYLVGVKVIVYTDHAALKYLLTKKDAKP